MPEQKARKTFKITCDKHNAKIITLSLILCAVALLVNLTVSQASAQWPHIVSSQDGVAIAYETYGSGEPTLVFVHGWSCDSRYWRAQIPYFSKSYRLVTLDLAGHGNSGMARSRYTMKAFGEDVRAVVENLDIAKVILVGHSMGGSVIAEAARLMPGRVLGLIGVDTLENIEYTMTPEERETMLAPLKKDFPAGTRQFVGQMISVETGRRLHQWIIEDMAAAPPAVAISAMDEMLSQYISGEAAAIFEEIRVPIISVNGELWPIDYEANRRHMLSYDAIVLKKADHFLMMNRAEEFNRALDQAITELSTENIHSTKEVSYK